MNRVLRTSGLGAASGYATVERVGGTAPYWAYAVVNDEASADGSIVPPLRAGAGIGHGRLVLPVLVEAGSFTSELVMTNLSSTAKRLRLEWVAEGVATADHVARLSAGLAAGEQLTVPSFVPGVGEPGAGLAGALFVSVEGGDADGLFVGARTSAAGRAGRYGVFTSALALSDLATDHAWVHGLRQDSGNRTNLAVVHAGEVGDGPAVFRVEIFDGASGLLVAAVEDLRLDERCWTQLGTVLAEAAPGLENGYARVQRTIGTAPFLAYAVVNDGSGPGLGTGDGSYVPMTVPKP